MDDFSRPLQRRIFTGKRGKSDHVTLGEMGPNLNEHAYSESMQYRQAVRLFLVQPQAVFPFLIVTN